MILVSVIIPVLNGAKTLSSCLESIREQKGVGEIEIIILDSMSIDNSREIAIQYGAFVVDIPKGTFNHGLTRNKGVEIAKGDFVVMTVQDACLKGDDALSNMLNHFTRAEVMGVVGHQAIPESSRTNPIFWYSPQTKPFARSRQKASDEDPLQWSQPKKREMFAWDDVIAMYRKSALVSLPFIKTDFAEDWVWCAQALNRGWTLVYDPSVVAFHYHHRTFNYVFQTQMILNHNIYSKLKVLPTIPRFFYQLARAGYVLLKNKKTSLSDKIFWFLHEFLAQTAELCSYVLFMVALRLKGEHGTAALLQFFVPDVPQGSTMSDEN